MRLTKKEKALLERVGKHLTDRIASRRVIELSHLRHDMAFGLKMAIGEVRETLALYGVKLEDT